MQSHPEPTEDNVLEQMLGVDLWRRYKVQWCHACDTAVIVCPDCHCGSCSGGGCEKCAADFSDFAKIKRKPRDYLTPDELAVYQKGLRLQWLILQSIRRGDREIDWKSAGLSEHDAQVFSSFLK